MPQSNLNDDDSDKNAAYRSSRRAAQSNRAKRNSGRAHRPIVVHGKRREEPDRRKIARAIIAIAMADAHREAEAERGKEPSNE
jgi:hypothetical protein